MLDRWIPDEDWVRLISEHGKANCSIVTFNTVMSQQCVWQNNHAILGGTTLSTTRLKQQAKQFIFTMLCLLVSQFQPSQATKASTSRYGMTQKGAIAEIMVSMFAIASNNFMQEYHGKTHHDPANQPTSRGTSGSARLGRTIVVQMGI
jgi:hypothetical protein